MYEKTYLEMLEELYNSLKSNSSIPQKDKKKIEKEVQKLFEMLWAYSA